MPTLHSHTNITNHGAHTNNGDCFNSIRLKNHLREKNQQFTWFSVFYPFLPLSPFWLRMMTVAMKQMKKNNIERLTKKVIQKLLKLSQNWCMFTYLITTQCKHRMYEWWLAIGRNNLHANLKQFFSSRSLEFERFITVQVAKDRFGNHRLYEIFIVQNKNRSTASNYFSCPYLYEIVAVFFIVVVVVMNYFYNANQNQQLCSRIFHTDNLLHRLINIRLVDDIVIVKH